MSRRRKHRCFELDGAMVHGDPDMSEEAREAVREVIAAAVRQMEKTSPARPPGSSEITDTGETDR